MIDGGGQRLSLRSVDHLPNSRLALPFLHSCLYLRRSSPRDFLPFLKR